MAQMCPAKSTIVPFKKQMYGSGSIILSYKDDKCICVSIHAPTRGATNQLRSTDTSIMFQSTHPRGVRHVLIETISYLGIVSIHAPTRGATPISDTMAIISASFNPRTHEGCDQNLTYI